MKVLIRKKIHDKTGKVIWLVRIDQKQRVGKEITKQFKDFSRSIKGVWSKFASAYKFETDPFSSYSVYPHDTLEIQQIDEVGDMKAIASSQMEKTLPGITTNTNSPMNSLPPVLQELMPRLQQFIVLKSDELMSTMPELEKRVSQVPKLYSQEGKGNDAVVYLHYFSTFGASHWWITEWDGKDTFFGYAVFQDDWEMSELGYSSRVELTQTKGIELDFHFYHKTLNEVLAKVRPGRKEPKTELAIVEPKAEYVPRDDWQNNIIKAREYALSLGIETKGKTIEQLVDEINAKTFSLSASKYDIYLKNDAGFASVFFNTRKAIKFAGANNYPNQYNESGGVYRFDVNSAEQVYSLVTKAKEAGLTIDPDLDFTDSQNAIIEDIIAGGKKIDEQPQDLVIKPPAADVNISIKTSDYPNAFELNKAIESFLDKNPDKTEWSAEEIAFLSNYSGSGGLAKFGATGAGLLHEFYTPEKVAYKMWGLAYKHGFKSGSVLEPSCGVGMFFRFAPRDSELYGYELNKYSARIVKILYPRLKLNIIDGAELPSVYFEQVFIKNNYTIKAKTDHLVKHDLVIGNPPYTEFNSRYAGMGEREYTHAQGYVDYFLLRGLDLVKPGGLLVYLVGVMTAAGGELFLRRGMNKTKEMMLDRADLIDAYRLPDKIFERTECSTEILVFRKK